MTNLFGSLDIGIWDFIGIWRLGFEISEYLNTWDIIPKDYPSIEYSTVKFHARFFYYVLPKLLGLLVHLPDVHPADPGRYEADQYDRYDLNGMVGQRVTGCFLFGKAEKEHGKNATRLP